MFAYAALSGRPKVFNDYNQLPTNAYFLLVNVCLPKRIYERANFLNQTTDLFAGSISPIYSPRALLLAIYTFVNW